MKTLTRTILLAAALLAIAAPAGASRLSRPAARAARQPARLVRLLMRPFQRERAAEAGVRPTGVRREARREIDAYAQLMEGSIYQNATPPFQLVHMAAGARVRQTRQPNYKKGVTARFEVSDLGPGGSFPVTALLPVSGHVGQAEAARYARSNVYVVEIEYADGTSQTMRVNSTGYVTEQPLELALVKGTNYVRFHAEGSAGVGGFRSGREIELEYDGT